MPLRVALLGIYHESNTFIRDRSGLDEFRNTYWLKGEAIRAMYRDAFHEIGGMLEEMEEEDITVVPVFYASATPGGIVTAAACDILLNEMMEALDAVLPVDGCLVVPHGAAVSETYPDMDGHWLSLLRKKLGKDVPVIGTLDPHANVSQKMVDATDALVAYSTNPHVDQRQTGRIAAKLMADMLKKRKKPVQALSPAALAISIEQQQTDIEPCRSLYKYAAALVRSKALLSVSICLGFPYADVEEMGTSVLVVTDDDLALAASAAGEITDYLMQNAASFDGEKTGITEALQLLANAPKPALLLDMGDNVGGGAPGNGIDLAAALEKQALYRYFVCLYDPAAVQQAAAHRPGEQFALKLRVNGDENCDYGNVKLLWTADGKFTEKNPRHGGQVSFDMGAIAAVSTGTGSVLMLTSLRVPPFSLQQITAFGISPGDFDVVIAKGVNAPIAAYGPVCPTIIKVNTPGPTQADMTLFEYFHRRRPLFPFERDEAGKAPINS